MILEGEPIEHRCETVRWKWEDHVFRRDVSNSVLII